ncbi:major head protein [Stenotrophomonas phage Siara]|uniref:Major capsid protein n=1 Tax=Stenotrophomonas phage Siara TaxID=2859658 RepID=A0AAE8BLJ8_9CAUD|nr:major head protein [Stenotrophomonas phage Siara]QYW02038.1 major capsid protein [Stenotrophomonas phage Siara]
MAVTRISDVVVPEVFAPYVQNYTEEKSNLIQSSAIVVDSRLTANLSGGGLTFNEPSWRDLSNEDENISNDDPDDKSTPAKTGSLNEVQIRLSRNKSWSTMDLAGTLAGSDPMTSIGNRVGYYWTRRLQKLFVATGTGIFANDALATDGNHIQGEMTNNVSGSAFIPGVTNFTTEAFLDTLTTMGDSEGALGIVMMHSIVFNRARKNNLIDYIPDSEGRVNIPYFLGKLVIVDDGMPNKDGVYDTWIFGSGAFRFGNGLAPVPVAVERKEDAGHGGGQEILYNRVEWCLHPAGYAWVGDTTTSGGPSNAATAGNIAAGTSWKRVFPERKQIPMARMVTREFGA